ncbi:MAG: winged helix-turn-helix transcriptional regulator [Roseibacillus sp.]|nr:winged helix-turn-helix transcriptional regulator [Roseibacillus sp.]
MNERNIMKMLQAGACPVNEVADRLDVPISTILASMGRLEARGLLEVRAGWAEPALTGSAIAGRG